MIRAIKNTLARNTNNTFHSEKVPPASDFRLIFANRISPTVLVSQIEGDTSYCKGRDDGVDIVSNKSKVTVLSPLIAHVHTLGSPIDSSGSARSGIGAIHYLECRNYFCRIGLSARTRARISARYRMSRLIQRRAASFLNLVPTSPLTYAPFATSRRYD